MTIENKGTTEKKKERKKSTERKRIRKETNEKRTARVKQHVVVVVGSEHARANGRRRDDGPAGRKSRRAREA